MKIKKKKKKRAGHLGGSVVEHLPLAQVMILGSWDQVPHWAPCSVESLLLPLPFLAAHDLSIILFFSNK